VLDMPATANERLSGEQYDVTIWNHGVMVEPKGEDDFIWYPRE